MNYITITTNIQNSLNITSTSKPSSKSRVRDIHFHLLKLHLSLEDPRTITSSWTINRELRPRLLLWNYLSPHWRSCIVCLVKWSWTFVWTSLAVREGPLRFVGTTTRIQVCLWFVGSCAHFLISTVDNKDRILSFDISSHSNAITRLFYRLSFHAGIVLWSRRPTSFSFKLHQKTVTLGEYPKVAFLGRGLTFLLLSISSSWIVSLAYIIRHVKVLVLCLRV